MRVVSKDFLNENEYRAYPIDAAATYEPYTPNDVGAVNSLLTDMRITVPSTVAACVFLANVTVTKYLITMTFMGANTHPFSPTITPPTLFAAEYSALGAYVIAKVQTKRTNDTAGTTVSVTPMVPGVGGWVTLGSGAANEGYWSFAGPSSSLISDHCITRYDYSGVTTIGQLGFTDVVAGAVTLIGQGGIEVIAAGSEVTLQFSGTQQEVKSSLASYVGECGGRPESKTCAFAPIKTINGIRPAGEFNDIVLVLDKPIYAELVAATTANETFNLSSDAKLEQFCRGRINIPNTCESMVGAYIPQRAVSSFASIVTPTPGLVLTAEVYGPSGNFTANFRYIQQSPINAAVAVFTSSEFVALPGEFLNELHLDMTLGEWQLYGAAGVSMSAFGPLLNNLRGYKSVDYQGATYRIYLGVSTVCDLLKITTIRVSIDALDAFEEQGTYIKTGHSLYTHSQLSEYTLEFKSVASDTWSILKAGILVAAGTLDAAGRGVQVQTYRRPNGESALRTIGVIGVINELT